MQIKLENVTMRNALHDSFKDKQSGDQIEYSQLQCENIEDNGRITIYRVSVPKELRSVFNNLEAMIGKQCDLPVSLSGNGNAVKYRLDGTITASAKPVRAAS